VQFSSEDFQMKEAIEKPGLRRELGLFSSTSLVVASMIGTGIFTTSGFIIEQLGNPQAMLLCWVAGGIFALSGALCYAELGAMFPRSGGEYRFLHESLGRPVAFLSGWISLIVGFSAPIAASSIAFARYALRAVYGSGENIATIGIPGLESLSIPVVPIIAVSLIILFSMVHMRRLSIGSKVQDWLTVFKVALVVGFIIAAIVWGRGSTSHFAGVPRLQDIFSGEFAVSLIFISFAYSGWNAATYLGGEVRNPARNIPPALIAGTLVVVALYICLNVAFIYALPVAEMTGVIEVGAVTALSLFGEGSSRFISAAIAVCILSVIGAMILTGPRVYYAMARDRLFFERFGRLSRKQNIPSQSVWLQAVLAILMVLTAAFDTLLIYIGFTLSLAATLTVVGMILLRMKRPQVQRPYKTLGYPVTPILFILGNMWIVYFSLKSKPVASLFGLATIGVGILAYQLFRKRTGDK
jgi:APA family basic amino acid/polyamine antiporter